MRKFKISIEQLLKKYAENGGKNMEITRRKRRKKHEKTTPKTTQKTWKTRTENGAKNRNNTLKKVQKT